MSILLEGHKVDEALGTTFGAYDNGVAKDEIHLSDIDELLRAQLKKIVEWGEESCKEHLNGLTARKCCGTCIKALKKEAGID